MARRKLQQYLIPKDTISEELKLITGSNTDYITRTGKIYKDYGNNMMFPKQTFVNKVNGYLYCNITYSDGQKQRRVHRLVAEAFIPNPNNYSIVMHLDNNKANPNVENLQWGTTQENTQSAYDQNLMHNAQGWEDSQSIPVCVFDMKHNLIATYGSAGETAKHCQVTKSGVLYQCNHKIKTKPRCGYYFRFYSEYQSSGFVL